MDPETLIIALRKNAVLVVMHVVLGTIIAIVRDHHAASLQDEEEYHPPAHGAHAKGRQTSRVQAGVGET